MEPMVRSGELSSPVASRFSRAGRILNKNLGVILLCCFFLSCNSPRTIVTDTWHSPLITARPLGNTLVLAYTLFPRPIVGLHVEDIWVEQLGRYGVNALSWSYFSADGKVPSMGELADILTEYQFDTLLVTQLISFKRLNRNVPNSQVAIVETRLYLAPTEEVYWSLQSESFLANYIMGEIRRPREGDALEYVETVIQEMMKDGVF
ncbi:hypothetical protein FIU95_13805 [Microbulbifer sp. THAF38]|nr:hypothetical protein FIU95_13805 [Microbulbifer sp. THAF38]